MKWKTVAIVGAVLFLAGFLLEYQRASKLAKAVGDRAAGKQVEGDSRVGFAQLHRRIEDELRISNGRFGTDVWPCQGSG